MLCKGFYTPSFVTHSPKFYTQMGKNVTTSSAEKIRKVYIIVNYTSKSDK
jgi:hypothetical protein